MRIKLYRIIVFFLCGNRTWNLGGTRSYYQRMGPTVRYILGG
jgi:hypothetical protein